MTLLDPFPRPGESDRSPEPLRPESRGHEGWMDGVERFFESIDAETIAGLVELRVLCDPAGKDRAEILLVLNTISRATSTALCSAARQAFPGWPIRVAVRIDAKESRPELAG